MRNLKTTVENIAKNNHLIEEDYRDIATGLQKGTLIGASDITHKNGLQARWWTLCNKTNSKLTTEQCPIPGNPNTANSTRAERGINR